jgi:GT2 family glycosyltransferase
MSRNSGGALCAVLTCHNRRALTISGLACLERSARHAGVSLRAVLVDDGSMDGTADAVRATFAWVVVIVHSGPPLFWSRGMNVGMLEAARLGFDRLLLLNDDTMLDESAISMLLECEASVRIGDDSPLIVVGSTRDPDSGEVTYGGERRASKWKRSTFSLVLPGTVPVKVDSLNGNIVLFPSDAFGLLGPIDPTFEHSMGDIDLGLRAAQAAVEVWLAPGTLGTCSMNSINGTARDKSLGLRDRWQQMLGRKGLPWRSYLHFTRRHCGPAWLLFFVWPYVRFAVQSIWDAVARRPSQRK